MCLSFVLYSRVFFPAPNGSTAALVCLGLLTVEQRSLSFFLQLREPATAQGRQFLHDLMTSLHFKSLFVMYIIGILTMKIKKSSCAATFRCAREHFSYCAPAHLHTLEGTLLSRPRDRT
jgi:hypothetical protein